MSKPVRISVRLDTDVAKMLSKATTDRNGQVQRGLPSIKVNEALREKLKRDGFALPWSGGRASV